MDSCLDSVRPQQLALYAVIELVELGVGVTAAPPILMVSVFITLWFAKQAVRPI